MKPGLLNSQKKYDIRQYFLEISDFIVNDFKNQLFGMNF